MCLENKITKLWKFLFGIHKIIVVRSAYSVNYKFCYLRHLITYCSQLFELNFFLKSWKENYDYYFFYITNMGKNLCRNLKKYITKRLQWGARIPNVFSIPMVRGLFCLSPNHSKTKPWLA